MVLLLSVCIFLDFWSTGVHVSRHRAGFGAVCLLMSIPTKLAHSQDFSQKAFPHCVISTGNLFHLNASACQKLLVARVLTARSILLDHSF